MKIETIKDTLRTAVGQVERMTGKNLSLPVLSGIFLSAKNNTLLLRSTNLDLGIEISLQAKVESLGEIIVPGGVLSSLLSGVYDKKVVLEESQGNLQVVSQSASSVIKGLPNEDFPTLPVIQDEEGFEVSAEKFIDGVRSVWYSASTSDIKPEIGSVYIYQKDDDMVFAATDSFRLAEKKMSIKSKAEGLHLLVPYKNIVEVIRVFEGTSENISIKFNKNQISFATSGTYVTSRVIDGIFPDYEQIIPKSFITEATVLKQDLLNSLKVSNIFADKFNRVDITVSPKGKTLELKSQNASIGENTFSVDAAIEGEEIKLGFNQKYIMDCFQSIKQESVVLRFAGAGKPLVIQGVGDKSFLYLIMPLNQ